MDVTGLKAPPPWLECYWGAFGVDLFFVISGFVIALTVHRATTTWRSFLSARLARVVPLYALVTIASLFVFRDPVVAIPAERLFNSFLYLPVTEWDEFAGTLHPYGWTLSFEMYFYLLATVLIALAGRGRAIPVLVLLLGVSPLVFIAAHDSGRWYFPRFALSPLAIEFALGCIAFHMTRLRLPASVGILFLIAGTVSIVLSADHAVRLCWMREVLNRPEVAFERLLLWGVPAFLLVTGAVAVEKRLARFPWPRAAERSGSVSYPMYLIQPFALLATRVVCEWSGVIQPTVVAGVATTLTISMGVLFHRTTEVPLTAAARRWLDRQLGVHKGLSHEPGPTVSSGIGIGRVGEVLVTPGR